MRKLLVASLIMVLTVTSALTAVHEAKAFSRVGALTMNAGENYLASAVIDSAAGFAYFGTQTDPGIVVKVRLSDFARVGSLTLNRGEAGAFSAVIDSAAGFAYFGTQTNIVKVRLSDFTRVGSLTLNTGVSGFASAVIDSVAGFAYFGTFFTSPGIVVKVRLSDFTSVGSLTLNAGESNLFSAVIDTAGGFAYFGTQTDPGIVVKVRLSDFARVGSLTLNAGENYLSSAVIDSVAGFAYFGTSTSPGIIVKVDVSVGPSPDTTSTTVSCTPSTIVVNQATSCTSTVTDTSTGPTTPTGTVTFTPSGTCILAGAGALATCSVDITPTESGTTSVSASYGGDTTHQSSSGSFDISVSPGALSVSFTVSANPAVGSPVTFTATVTGGTAPYTFNWDFGDGSAAGTGNPVTHTYTSEGAETVTLTVTDASGILILLDDTWEFQAGSWTQLFPSSSPPPRFGALMAYDDADGYVLLFGESLGDTWRFQGGTWTQLFPSSSPPPRFFASMAYDAADGYVLLFGGYDGVNSLGDTWEFHAGAWTQLSPPSSPSPRRSASMSYDTADGYVLLFGGYDGVNSLGDTWRFQAGTWTQLSPSSSPPPIAVAPMAYDVADGYVLLFGVGPGLSDTWEFHAGQWTQLFPSSSPSQGQSALMAYDAADGYVLFFGLIVSTGLAGDTWEFQGGVWTQLSPTSSPSPRSLASMVYDAADGYVLLFGGITVSAPNQSTTSQTISVAASSSDFTISASPASVTIPPDTGISTITITPTNGFTGTVDLTSTIFPATGLTCTLTPTSITGGSSTSMLSCSGIAGSYTVTVTGISGSLSHSVDVAFTIAPAADFTIFAGPARVTVKVGDTGTSIIVVNGFNGFTATVDLTHVESPTTGLTCSLSPTSVTGSSGSSTLSCTGIAGIYTVTVSGVSGTASHSVDVSFIVTSAPDFNIAASPASVNMVAGDTGTSTITISPTNSFTGTVDLTQLESPAGLTCSLSPTVITGGSGTSTLSCTGSVGIYTVTVSGTSGPLIHSVGVTFIVTPPIDFAISTGPTSVTTVEGETGTSTITVDSVNSFTGTVSLTSTIFPGLGLTCTLSPTDVILGPFGTSTLSCSGTEGTYTVTVTGTSGSLTHSVNVAFIVNLPFDFDISSSPTRVTVAEGSTGTSTITIIPLNGFTGIVDITHSLSVGTGLTCSLDPTSIADGSGSSTLSCSGSAGIYAVTITGTSGTLSHSLDVIFDVTPLPDFTIGASLTSVSIIVGDTGTSTITVTGVNGFTETVDLTSTISPATGLTCSFSPTSITGGSGTSTLSCRGSAGTHTVTVTGTSGTLSHSVEVMFTVTAPPPDFTISASPTSVTFAEGSSGTSTITVAPLNGFTGTVDLTSSISPGKGLTCSLTPTSITGGSGTSTLSCTGSANTYTVTVTGTSGPLTHPLDVTFGVTFLTPAQASQNLINAVQSLHLSKSAQTSLLGPLHNIVQILSDNDPTNDTIACNKLSSFINIVNNDQRKGILTMEQAAQLRQLATSIMAQLGC